MRTPFKILGLMIVGLIVVGLIASMRNQTSHDLRATIRRTAGTIIVVNNDSQDWSDVRLQVNDRFRCRVAHLRTTASETVALPSCVADDGARFVPSSMAAVNVTITARGDRDMIDGFAAFTFK